MNVGTTNFCPHVPPGAPPCAACRGDYNALNNRQLDKLVAERLGYQSFSYFDNNYRQTRWNFRLNGAELNYAAYNENALWAMIAPYSVNISVTLELLVAAPAWILHYTETIGYIARVEGGAQVVADTPARAIVLAWLAWKDAR